MPASQDTAGKDVARKRLRDAIERDPTGILEGTLTNIDRPGIADFARLRLRRDAARLFKDWFALKDPPTHFRIVRFDRTVDVRVGIASQHRKLGDGNGIQMQILEELQTSWFGKPQLIQ